MYSGVWSLMVFCQQMRKMDMTKKSIARLYLSMCSALLVKIQIIKVKRSPDYLFRTLNIKSAPLFREGSFFSDT